MHPSYPYAQPRTPFFKRPAGVVTIIIGAVTALIIALVAAIALASAVSDNNADQDALEACESALREKAKYPSGLTIVEHTTTDYDGIILDVAEDSKSVRGEADLVNGFGTPVRHTFECAVEPDSNVQFAWLRKAR